MKLNSIRPTLWVDNVRATIDWYVNTLGFNEADYVEEWHWGAVVKDEVEIMFSRPNEHMAYNGAQFTGSLYMNTNNVEAWWKKLKDDQNIFYEIESFDYGMKEFAIKDCNGYILQFGQNIS